MLRPLFRSALFVLVALALAACASKPKPVDMAQVYNVRAVTVSANGGISRDLLNGIKAQMDKAARATVRPVDVPRVVMDIRVVSASNGPGINGGRAQAEVSVVLAEVTSGHPVLVRNFVIYAFAESRRATDAAFAEAISSRLRFEYALTTPRIHTEPRFALQASKRPISTRMGSDEDMPVDAERPLVIPLKTAPVIGVDQDPILNSKTKLEPVKKDVVPEAAEKVEKPAKAAEPVSDANQLESGAAAKVVIQPKAVEPAPAAADDEPCVETLEKKCQ